MQRHARTRQPLVDLVRTRLFKNEDTEIKIVMERVIALPEDASALVTTFGNPYFFACEHMQLGYMSSARKHISQEATSVLKQLYEERRPDKSSSILSLMFRSLSIDIVAAQVIDNYKLSEESVKWIALGDILMETNYNSAFAPIIREAHAQYLRFMNTDKFNFS